MVKIIFDSKIYIKIISPELFCLYFLTFSKNQKKSQNMQKPDLIIISLLYLTNLDSFIAMLLFVNSALLILKPLTRLEKAIKVVIKTMM